MAIKINAEKLLMKMITEMPVAKQVKPSVKPQEAYQMCLELIVEKILLMMKDSKLKKKAKCKNGPHKITEVCTFCENAVTLYWDTKHDGYEIYCPCCGKRMTLKDAYYREVTAKEQEDADNKKFQPKEGEDCVY